MPRTALITGQSDPPDIRGDYSLLNGITGWRPTIPIAQTLQDIWLAVRAT